MAVFEKKVPGKVTLDDTEALSCKIENAQNISGHTEYVIRVQRGPLPEKSWHIFRRYRDFASLHASLQISGILLPIPPKKIIGNMEREFVAERQAALQNYLTMLLSNPILASSLHVKKFLDPTNYLQPFQEVALQHVSMAFRSEMEYEVMRPLPDVGWRLRKQYFLVQSKSNIKEEKLLSWVDHGPDMFLSNKELQAVFKSMATMKHSYIMPTELLCATEGGGLAVRSMNNAGTLRDLICGAKPRQAFLKKYGNPKQYKPLSINDVSRYGRDILEALKFLHGKGLPYGHLHVGNVVIENGMARLLDVENGVLGLPSYYRPYFLQLKKVDCLEAVDVYCFGHTIYEMMFGKPLHAPTCDNFPEDCPQLVYSLLLSILSSDACRHGLPSITSLLTHPLFGCVPDESERGQLKLSSRTKEALKCARQQVESRLNEERKVIRHQRRMQRTRQLLNSEVQITMRVQKLKQQRQEPSQQEENINGKSPNRSDSPNSTSTATSAGTSTPPLSSDVQSPPPPPLPMTSSSSNDSCSERGALLSAICNFNQRHLKKALTIDKSCPKI